MMQLFDQLISNVDRNQGNIVYTKDWRLWLIDHTRAFRKNTELEDPGPRHALRPAGVRASQGARSRHAEGAKSASSWTTGRSRSLLARRDAIVKKLESLGPTALFDRDREPGHAAGSRDRGLVRSATPIIDPGCHHAVS